MRPRTSSRGRHGRSLPLDVLIGPAWVAWLSGRGPITAEKLAGAVPAGTTRLLIRTENSNRLGAVRRF